MNRERLFERLPGPKRSDSVGADQIANMAIGPELLDDLDICLRSDDECDTLFGLFFLDQLLRRSEFLSAIEARSMNFAEIVRKLALNGSERLRHDALRCFVAFRNFYPDFEQQMKALLENESELLRTSALELANYFLKKTDIHLLLPFSKDTQADETRGMGGPLRYVWRDCALEKAELISGKSFANGDCFERKNGSEISWRSWSAFTIWLENR